MSCPKCIYFDFENGEKSDRCPSPKVKFNDCMFYTSKKDKKALKDMIPSVKKLKSKSEKIIPPPKLKLKTIEKIDKIEVCFDYTCRCNNKISLKASYIGNNKITRFCHHCGKSFKYIVQVKKGDEGDYGFQTRVVIEEIVTKRKVPTQE